MIGTEEALTVPILRRTIEMKYLLLSLPSYGMREMSDFFSSLCPSSVSFPLAFPSMIVPGGIVYSAHGMRYEVSVSEIPLRCLSLSSGVVC